MRVAGLDGLQVSSFRTGRAHSAGGAVDVADLGDALLIVPAGAGGLRKLLAEAVEAAGAAPLDAPPAWWPEDLFGEWRLENVGEILLHMITEVACHAGHLDAVRELIDGRQWRVLAD